MWPHHILEDHDFQKLECDIPAFKKLHIFKAIGWIVNIVLCIYDHLFPLLPKSTPRDYYLNQIQSENYGGICLPHTCQHATKLS